jgi:hypothetical protein
MGLTPRSFFWLNLVPLVCVSAALAMALYDKPGWGWFLFVAVCFVPTSKDSLNTTENPK